MIDALEDLTWTRDVSLFMTPQLNIFPELGSVPNASSIENLKNSPAIVHITHRRRGTDAWRLGWVEFEATPVMIIRNGGENDLFPQVMVLEPTLHRRLLRKLFDLLVDESDKLLSQPLDGALVSQVSERSVEDATLLLPSLIHFHYWDSLEPPVKPFIQQLDPALEL